MLSVMLSAQTKDFVGHAEISRTEYASKVHAEFSADYISSALFKHYCGHVLRRLKRTVAWRDLLVAPYAVYNSGLSF